MASEHASLDAAAIDRKARLARLASVKRKQPPTENDEDNSSTQTPLDPQTEGLQISKHLSGRNYDYESRGPRLGFEKPPTEGQDTLEDRARTLAKAAQEQEKKEKEQEKPLDLFTLQPKKPNWDLKRDLAKKMELLDQRTDNAVRRIVKEKIEGQKKERTLNGNTNVAEGEELGIAGVDLVEGVKIREREEEEDERREKEEESDTG